MATKLKNNKLTRILIAVVLIMIVTAMNILFFPVINEDVEKQVSVTKESASEEYVVNTELLQSLYEGSYVLYYEHMKQAKETNYEPEDLYLEQESGSSGEDVSGVFRDIYFRINNKFESYRSQLDYCATDGADFQKNTERMLDTLLEETPDREQQKYLKELYQHCLVLHFDEHGTMNFSVKWSDDVPVDILIKNMQKIEREKNLQDIVSGQWGEAVEVIPIKNFTVVYGILKDVDETLLLSYEGAYDNVRYDTVMQHAGWLYVISILILFVCSFILTSPKIWPDIKDFNRKGKWYVFEAMCIGVTFVVAFYSVGLCDLIYMYGHVGIDNIRDLHLYGTRDQWYYFWNIVWCTGLIYVADYLTFLALRPVFTLGIGEYIRQYSFFYQIFPWMKKVWKKFKSEINHIDFSAKSTKTILKIVIINFAILAVLMCMWMFGLFGLVIYSVVLFYLLRKYYDKIAKDYRILMNATSRIANGDLNTIIMEDIGVFEPFKEELWKIRTGFKKAVDEETKSQRMKSELITNVSHDLKTPLTAITTYVELLKKEDITEEERRSYIETLDKKSLRLKVLIEDLFEVSKASSNNITLNLMDVDVVNLMKQVSIEHTDKYEAMGIDLRWNVPEEKVILKLDNQKTYRIFENLFVNIQKYAMPNSRVYIDVEKMDTKVQITMKNMSAVELNVRPDELTERFVRGDASRNTEGSGLGLAIAKSFTEAQNGVFTISVDGDLFKTVLLWRIEI